MRPTSSNTWMRRSLALTCLIVLGSAAASARDWRCPGRPAPINKTGFEAGTTVRYAVGGSPGGRSFPSISWPCVRAAFEAWTRANAETGLNVRFVPGPGGIVVRFDGTPPSILGSESGGGWSAAEDGARERAIIWISGDQALVDDCRGITKIVLHELGHLHGLADQPGYTGPSVMNRGVRRNDRGERIPMAPTRCDATQALAAARQRPGVVLARGPQS